MDNAARALIMAASIILGVMLLSTFVYVFRVGASVDQAYDEAQNERELRLANAKFDVYDKPNNTIMDILTVINLAYNTNEDFLYDKAKAVEVLIKIGDKVYSIPRVEPEGDARKEFKRNKLFIMESLSNSYTSASYKKDNIISIYNLVDKKLTELGINIAGKEDNDKLSTTKLGKSIIRNPDGKPKTDEEGKQVYRNNVTIYKYIFKSKCVCGDSSHSLETGFTYNLSPSIGRVVKIEFEAQYNQEEWELKVE